MIDDVEVRDAGSKGCGVYARRRFATGEFIFRRRHLRVLSVDKLDDVSEWERMRTRLRSLRRARSSRQ
jgi:hypothetical protein